MGHAFLGKLALRLFAFGQVQSHAVQDLRRLRKLNVGVIDDLDPVAPRIEEVQDGPSTNSAPASRASCRTEVRSSTTRPKWRWLRSARTGPFIKAMN